MTRPTPTAIAATWAATDKPVVVLSNGRGGGRPGAGRAAARPRHPGAGRRPVRSARAPATCGTTRYGRRRARRSIDAAPRRPGPTRGVDAAESLRLLASIRDQHRADVPGGERGRRRSTPPSRAAGRWCSRPTSQGSSTAPDVGGVRVGLATPEALSAAYDELAADLGPRVVVQPLVDGTGEVALGLVRDPHLGPLLVAGHRRQPDRGARPAGGRAAADDPRRRRGGGRPLRSGVRAGRRRPRRSPGRCGRGRGPDRGGVRAADWSGARREPAGPHRPGPVAVDALVQRRTGAS